MKETLFVPKIIKDDNTYWGVEADNSNFNFDSIKQSFQRLRETTMVSSAEGETINSITELNQYTTQGSYSIHLSDGGNGSLPALNGAYDFTLDVRRASDNGSIIIQQQIFSDKVYQRIVPNTVWTLVSNDYATQRKLTETLNKLSNILDIDNTTGSYLKRKIGDKTYYLGINDTPAPVYISYNELGVSKIEELATKQYVDDVLNGDIPSAGFATKQYVDSSIAKLVGSSPDTLDTLYELAEALGNDPNFSETVFSEIGKKWTQDNNLINKWNKFADYFERVFKIYYTDSTNTTIERVEVLYPFNSVSEIWAYGAGEMGGGGGNIGSLYDLPEISINPETLQTGDVLIYNKTTTHWYAVASSTLKPDLSGYVTTTSLTDTLKDYVLTTTLNSTLNNYVTTTTLNNTLTNYVTTTSLTDTLKDYVLTTTLNSEVEKLKKVTDVFKIYYTDSTNTTIERVEVLYPFNSVSEIWAYGAGEMGGGGSLISNVYGYSDLGNTYLDADLDNTFNAYTINRLAERIGALETGGGGGLDEAALETYLTTNNYYYSGNSNKSDVNWTTNRLTTSGITLESFSNSSSSEQWIRVFTSHSANNGSSINSALLMIGRNWSHASEESYTFMVTVGYDWRASINQLSSSTATQLFDKIRLLWKNGSIWYIDIHYTGTVSNDIFVSGSGCGNFSCSPNPTIPEGYTAKEFKVWQNSVCFSNSLILDTGIDTKLIFNNTDGEKYTTLSFRENNAEYAYINVDGRDNGTFTFSGLPVKVDGLYLASEGKPYINNSGNLYIPITSTGGDARGIWYRRNSTDNPTDSGIGAYYDNTNFGYLYMGWGSAPYNVNTNFHVNSERIRWKGQDILTSGNYLNYTPNSLKVQDIRGTNYAPSEMPQDDNSISAYFNNTGMPTDDWWSYLNVCGWSKEIYVHWQLAGPSSTGNKDMGLFYRAGVSTSWTSWKEIAFVNSNAAITAYSYTCRGEVNAAGDIKTPVWMYAARHTSADGHSLVYIGNSSNENWVGIQDMCSAASIGDTNWSIRTNGSAHLKEVIFSGSNGYIRNINNNQVLAGSSDNLVYVGGSSISKLFLETSNSYGIVMTDIIDYNFYNRLLGTRGYGCNGFSVAMSLGNNTQGDVGLEFNSTNNRNFGMGVHNNGNFYFWSGSNSTWNSSTGKGYCGLIGTSDRRLEWYGNISATGEVTAYSGSDLRLKKNVEYLKRGLSIVRRINPIQYYWNEIGVHYKGDTWKDKKDISICSAQEMELVLPEIVHTMWDTEYIGYEERKILPYIINSIKQLDSVEQELISIQKNMIEILEQTDLNQKQQELMMGLKLSLINLKNLIS